MNEIDEDCITNIEELMDGDEFLLTHIEYGEECGQVRFTRKVAKELIKWLKNSLGDE